MTLVHPRKQLKSWPSNLLYVNYRYARRSLPKLVLLLISIHLLILSFPTNAEDSIFRPRGLVTELFGINEALSFPEKFERSGNVNVARLRQRLEQQGNAALNVGAQWTRGHTVAFPRLSWDRWERENHSFERADIWIKAVQSVGLEPVVMIGPWPGNQTRKFTNQYSLGDSNVNRYLEFVRQTVERYDGDGIDDMPGLLKGIQYWEVDNEPDLKNSGSPRLSKRTNFCTPDQFATLLLMTSKAIKQSSPNAKILNGGFYRVTNDFGYQYMKDFFAISGVKNAIDIISVHAYHSGRNIREVELALNRAQGLANGKPVWLTETSVPSDGAEQFQSPEGQAEILGRTVILALAHRIERFFWHTLFDPPKGKTSTRREIRSFATNSLHSKASRGSPLELKPSGYLYSFLAKELKGVQWADIESVKVSGGKGVALGNNKWLAYSDRSKFQISFPANRAKALVTGDSVLIKRINNRTMVFGNKQVLLLEKQ